MKKELDRFLGFFFSTGNPVFYALFFVGVIALIFYLVYFHIFLPMKKKQQKEKIETDLKNSMMIAEKFKTLTFQVQQKIEEEKLRIARELHDGIGHNLLLAKFQLESESNNKQVSALLDATVKDLKEMIFNIRPRSLEELGLYTSVVYLIEHCNKTLKMTGVVNAIGKPVKFSKETELSLYRVIQESINNIIKHSEATEYNIEMSYNNCLKIMIFDNGKGMNVEESRNKGGSGLFNMEERVKHLGGTIEIKSDIGDGTRIRMEIPYEG